MPQFQLQIQVSTKRYALPLHFAQSSTHHIQVHRHLTILKDASSNFWILNKNNILNTRFLDGTILAGITRDSILNCAKAKKIKVLEKKISLDDIQTCKEAFITSASSFVTPVIQVDNIKINNGKVGEFSNLLRKTYLELNN